jgi:hypothetical protein
VSDQLPSLWSREPLGVLVTQVVGVRLVNQCELPENGSSIFVRVGEGGYGLLTASHLGAGPSVHLLKNTMAL